jgi:hypothetical protein
MTALLALAASAAQIDFAAPFVGHYRGVLTTASGEAAVRSVPVALSIERSDDDLILILTGAHDVEMVFADDPSSFHLLERTAGPGVVRENGYLRIAEDGVTAHRSRFRREGEEEHIRLLLRKEGGALALTVLTSAGNAPLTVAAEGTLHRTVER